MNKEKKRRKKSSALVLFSSGLDSTVNLFWALEKLHIVEAVTFLYGQRAQSAELRQAKKICSRYKIKHHIINLPFISQFGGSSLTDKSKSIPTRKQVSMDDLKVSQKTAKSVWIPNRNGIFMNVAAGLAESRGLDMIIPGFNAEEAATFPDNSEDYLKKVEEALEYSTANQVKARCVTVKMNKTQIVELGLKLNVPFEMMWPCYFSGKTWCRQCESCQRSLRALHAAGLTL
jgi:7-cyano-7-deazaguanine synthase